MAFRFDERPDSRHLAAEPPQFITKWIASGEVSEQVVFAYALNATPAVVATEVGSLVRHNIEIEPNGFAQHIVTVTYGKPGIGSPNVGAWTFDFDTTGATVKMKCSKEHIKTYLAPVPEKKDKNGKVIQKAEPERDGGNPHKGSIGVKQDGDVEGSEIVIPALKLNIRVRHASGHITMAQVKTLARATGHTNQNPFLSYAAGELLYLGSTGSDGSQTEAEVNYQFAASENVSDLNFGEITNIVKQGHHLAWVEFKDDVDNGDAATPPKAVHIERMYDPIDMATTFGFS